MKTSSKRLLLVSLLATGLAGCSSLGDIGDSLSTGFGLWGRKDPLEQPAPLPVITQQVAVKAAWQASVGASGDYVFSPTELAGSVFAASNDGIITRLDADSGKVVWKIETGKKLSGGVGVGNGLVLVATSKGNVLAHDLDGKAVWETKVSSEVLSAPQAAEGVVVVRAADGRIFGLDTKDGKRKWIYQRELPTLSVRSHAGVLVSRGAVFAGFAGGKLVAISLLNGVLGWEASVSQPRGATELERIVDITSLPVLDGKQVCAVAYHGKVACFDVTNGNPSWSRELSSITGLTIDNAYLYVSDAKGAVHALDKSSGASIWKQDKLFNRRLTTPVVKNGKIIVADLQGYVHLLSREDGSFLGRAETDGSAVGAAPLLVGQNALVQTRNGGLFALAVE
ncbi:MAG: outer membrane protein assembly factor BamB [Sulfuricellaceae bacterium]|nr:outer membrane protein assembly factor BamB [Sulfuricellaceae bacterium]